MDLEECSTNEKPHIQLLHDVKNCVGLSRLPFRSSLISSAAMPLLVMISLLLLQPVASQTPYRTCYEALSSADGDRNSVLTQAEYVESLRILTFGAVSVNSYENLSEELKSGFTFRAPDGSPGVDISEVASSSSSSMSLFCTSIYAGLVESLGIATSQQACFIAMSVGDIGRDDALAAEPDFVRYANQMAGGSYGISISFASLPPPLQAVYNDFADGDNGIPVIGSKPGTTPTIEDQSFLTNLCRQTAVAVVAGEQPMATPATMAGTTPATSAPVSSPTDGAGSITPLFTFSDCTTAMLVSDLNRDDFFAQAEYLRFLNRLTTNAFSDQTFGTLPSRLQSNYNVLATKDGQIPVNGSKPGSAPSAEELASLENVCDSTETALREENSGGGVVPTFAPTMTTSGITMAPVPTEQTTGSPDPVAIPTLRPVTAPSVPTIPFNICTLNMATSDLDRSGSLSSNEYFNFVNKIAGNTYDGLTFDTLPDAVQEAFDGLSDGKLIDVLGSFPGQRPNEAREAELEAICATSLEAIYGPPLVTATTTPSVDPAPTTSPSAAQVQNIIVFNGFYIFNVKGVRAATLISGQNRDGLNRGYEAFVRNITAEFIATTQVPGEPQRHLRSRHLEEPGLAPEAARIYEIDDVDCPPVINVESTFCQIVYAEFEVHHIREPAADAFFESLTRITQDAIVGDKTGLNAFVLAANPNSDVEVLGPAEQLRPINLPGVQEPVPGNPVGAESGGNQAGLIAGIFVAIAVIVTVAGIVHYRKRKGDRYGLNSGFSTPSFFKRKPKSNPNVPEVNSLGSAQNHGEHHDLEDGFGRFETIETKSPMKPGGMAGFFGGSHHSKSGSDDEESGGFSVQEQSPIKRDARNALGDIEVSDNGHLKGNAFGGFGFGKKKLNKFPHSTNELDSSEYDDNEDDFANYGFEEPEEQRHDSMGDMFDILNQNEGETDWDPQHVSSAAWHGDVKGTWGGQGHNHDFGDDHTVSQSGSESQSHDNEEESGSYSEDDDSGSSDDNSYNGDDGGDTTRRTREPLNSRTIGASVTENMRHLDAMVHHGHWNGFVQKTAELAEDQSEGSEDESEEESFTGSGTSRTDSFVDDGLDGGEDGLSLNSTEKATREKYRLQVEQLVQKVAPEESDNINAMFDKFLGREAELLQTLESMNDRSASQRARKAVHRSKAFPQQSGRLSAGGLDGSAAIAAASTLGGGFYDNGDDEKDENRSSDENSQSYESSDEYSGNDSGSGSYEDDGQGSHRSDIYNKPEGSSRSGSASFDVVDGSYRSGSGSYDDAGSDSYASDSGSDENS